MNSQPNAAPATQLPRILGPWIATAIVVGTVIGSGVFKKASTVSDKVPDFGLAMAAWVGVGLLTLMGALALAEVAILLPRAGGNYVFLSEAYGRWAGFLYGWVEFWIIRCGTIAGLATIFSEAVHDILRQANGGSGDVLSFWARVSMTATIIGVLAVINMRGTRWAGGLQVVITAVKVTSLILIALLPFIVIALVNEPRARPTTAYITPAWPGDWLGVNWGAFGAALVGIFFAYHGWMNVAPVAEEIKNPSRNLPLAFIAGVFTVIVLYVGANLAYYSIIPRADLIKLTDRTVVGEFSFRLLGPVGLVLASTAVMISVFGALNGNMLGGPRLLFAMGRDGLAPRSLARLHPVYQTPARAAAILAGWSILLVLIVAMMTQNRLPTFELGSLKLDVNLPEKKPPFDVVTDFAMFGAISFETLAVASLFVFRRRFPVAQVQLPYRCPFYPWLPAFYVFAMTAVLINMFFEHTTESLIGVGFIIIGILFYALVLRKPSAITPQSSL